jgi:glutathione S-transferase
MGELVDPSLSRGVQTRLANCEALPSALNRYTFEAERHWAIVNDRLAGQPWMLGDTYTLVDMAVWGWSRLIPRLMGEQGWGRHQRPPRRAAGRGAEGSLCLQAGDRRRGEEGAVSAERAVGTVTRRASFSA